MRALAALTLAGLIGCSSGPRPLQKPTLTVTGLRFTGLTLETVNFVVDLNLNNPNSFGLPGAEIDFAVAIEGDPFVDGKMPIQGNIGSGRTHIQCPLQVHFLQVVDKIARVKGKDQFAFAIQGGVTADVGALGRLRFPFQQSGVLPVPQPIGVKVAGIKREKSPSPLAFRGRMTLELKNRNIFALTKVGGRVRIVLEGTDVGEFDASLEQPIAPGQEGKVAIELNVSVVNLITKLTSGRVKAHLTGSLGMSTPYGLLKIPVGCEETVSILN